MKQAYLGRAYSIRARLLKSGAPYNLTGAALTLRLKSPAGVVVTKSLLVTDAAAGIATASVTALENNELGPWRSQIDGTDGSGNDIPTNVTEFFVIPLL